ncbi:endonuclease V [Dactylosporangium sp. NPDC000244]|uniref:endonuclease V n=1 Tax=Dactylosporangium sp. NPDC000244 TaxID=3154365 RepID=UPI003318168D
MIRSGAVDVDYPDSGGGRAALVAGSLPGFAVETERVAWLDEVEAYVPGQFYRRELPAIRAVLAGVDPVELLIVDGYVDLDPDGRPGLGAHVHEALGIPVIGVAKTSFHTATHAVPVLRGGASKPLYVTATGLPPADAAAFVTGMCGPFRMPDALRRVDALARGRA